MAESLLIVPLQNHFPYISTSPAAADYNALDMDVNTQVNKGTDDPDEVKVEFQIQTCPWFYFVDFDSLDADAEIAAYCAEVSNPNTAVYVDDTSDLSFDANDIFLRYGGGSASWTRQVLFESSSLGGTFNLITADGDNVITDDGDQVVTSSANDNTKKIGWRRYTGSGDFAEDAIMNEAVPCHGVLSLPPIDTPVIVTYIHNVNMKRGLSRVWFPNILTNKDKEIVEKRSYSWSGLTAAQAGTVKEFVFAFDGTHQPLVLGQTLADSGTIRETTFTYLMIEQETLSLRYNERINQYAFSFTAYVMEKR